MTVLENMMLIEVMESIKGAMSNGGLSVRTKPSLTGGHVHLMGRGAFFFIQLLQLKPSSGEPHAHLKLLEEGVGRVQLHDVLHELLHCQRLVTVCGQR